MHSSRHQRRRLSSGDLWSPRRCYRLPPASACAIETAPQPLSPAVAVAGGDALTVGTAAAGGSGAAAAAAADPRDAGDVAPPPATTDVAAGAAAGGAAAAAGVAAAADGDGGSQRAGSVSSA